jgi:hypothetical protein
MSDGDKPEPSVRVIDRRWWARNDEGPAVDEGTRKPTVVEDLEQRLADTTAQLQTVIGDYRRSSEEFEQVKIRIRREVSKEVERGRRTLLAELLEVVDNLDRAIAAAGTPSGAAGSGSTTLARGVERDLPLNVALPLLHEVRHWPCLPPRPPGAGCRHRWRRPPSARRRRDRPRRDRRLVRW